MMRIRYLVNDFDLASGNEPPHSYRKSYRMPMTNISVYYRFPINYLMRWMEAIVRWYLGFWWKCFTRIFYPRTIKKLWSNPEKKDG